MLLQLPDKCGHYGQACRRYYSTEPLSEPSLLYYHPATFAVLPPYLLAPDLVHPVHPIQQVILQAAYMFF